MGLQAMEAGEGLPFDILALHVGSPVRVQTKATQSADNGRYTFITARGRYATKNRHAAPLTNYTGDEVDLLACAALPLDKVLFVPVGRVTGTKIVLLETAFNEEGAAEKSFIEGLKELRLI